MSSRPILTPLVRTREYFVKIIQFLGWSQPDEGKEDCVDHRTEARGIDPERWIWTGGLQAVYDVFPVWGREVCYWWWMTEVVVKLDICAILQGK